MDRMALGATSARSGSARTPGVRQSTISLSYTLWIAALLVDLAFFGSQYRADSAPEWMLEIWRPMVMGRQLYLVEILAIGSAFLVAVTSASVRRTLWHVLRRGGWLLVAIGVIGIGYGYLRNGELAFLDARTVSNASTLLMGIYFSERGTSLWGQKALIYGCTVLFGLQIVSVWVPGIGDVSSDVAYWYLLAAAVSFAFQAPGLVSLATALAAGSMVVWYGAVGGGTALLFAGLVFAGFLAMANSRGGQIVVLEALVSSLALVGMVVLWDMVDVPSWQQRVDLWRGAIEQWLASPATFLLGTGFGSSVTVEGSPEVWLYPHNVVIWAAWKTGVIGLTLMAAGALVVVATRRRERRLQWSSARWIAAYIVAIALTGLVQPIHHKYRIAHALWLAVGMWIGWDSKLGRDTGNAHTNDGLLYSRRARGGVIPLYVGTRESVGRSRSRC